MSVETIGYVRKNYKGPGEIFTSKMTINVSEEENGIIKIDINNGVAVVFLKKPEHLLKGGKKNKTAKKSKKKKNKTRKQRGGLNPFITKLLITLFLFFLFNNIIIVQLNHRSQNLLTEQEFLEQDTFIHPEVQNLLTEYVGNVIKVDFKNTTSLSDSQILQLIDMDGEKLDVNANSAITRDYNTAFAEIDFDKGSATKNMAKLLPKLPHVKHPFVGIIKPHRFYNIFTEWTIVGDEINVNLFNITNSENKHPDRRSRNFPADPNFDLLAKNTVKEQISMMRKTNLLKKNETNGFGSLTMINFAVIPSLTHESSAWHQDGMTHIISTSKTNKTKILEKQLDRAYGRMMQQNTTMSRSMVFDQIVTFTYEADVEETKVRITYNLKDGKTKKIPITTTPRQSHTLMLNQDQGKVQHLSRQIPAYKFPTNRNTLIGNFLPNQNNQFVKDPNITFTPRTN